MAKKPQKKSREKETPAKEETAAPDPGRDFINAIKAVSNRLMRDLNGTEDLTASQQDVLDTIAAAAKKYVDAEQKRSSEEKQEAKEQPISETAEAKAEDVESEEASTSQGSLFEAKAPKPAKESEADVTPEDINIEEPEEQLVIEPHESSPSKEGSVNTDPPTPASEPSSSKSAPLTNGNATAPAMDKAVTSLAAQKVNFKVLAEKLETFEDQANTLTRRSSIFTPALAMISSKMPRRSCRHSPKRSKTCSTR